MYTKEWKGSLHVRVRARIKKKIINHAPWPMMLRAMLKLAQHTDSAICCRYLKLEPDDQLHQWI